MAEFLSGGQLVDLAIGLTLFEIVALLVFHQITGRGLAPRHCLLNIFAGLCLMLGLRSALSNSGWMPIALALSASGLAHALDMYNRWQRQRTNT